MWHYTTEVRLAEILSSKALKATSYAVPDRVRHTLWFSSNPVWEATSAKRVGRLLSDGSVLMASKRLTFYEQVKLLGVARIQVVNVDLMPFEVWGAAVGASPDWLNSLKLGGLELGASPHEWFATFDDVPASSWVSVERWVPLQARWNTEVFLT